MKKFIALLLALTMVTAMFAACASEKPQDTTPETTEPETTAAPETTEPETTEPETTDGFETSGTPEIPQVSEEFQTIVDSMMETLKMELNLMTSPVNLENADELKYQTGLASAEHVTEAVIAGPMMGSQAYALVLARVDDAANAEAVANEMLNGVDPRKWICVGADQIMAAASGDVVMLIMTTTDFDGMGWGAQAHIDAFESALSVEEADLTLEREVTEG